MNIAVPRAIKSWFFVWVAAAIATSFFIFSFNLNTFRTTPGGILERITTAFGMPRINLGIDLQGGTRLVLRVDMEKSAEVKLLESAKDIERYLKRSSVAIPLKKGVVAGKLKLHFTGEAQADAALRKIKEGFAATELEAAQAGSDITVSLVESYKERIRANSIDQAVNVLRNRLDTIDVKSLTVSKHGSSNVVVMLPGMSAEDTKDIKAAISRSARLDFKIVEGVSGSKTSLLDRFGGMLPPDKMLIQGKGEGEEAGGMWYLVSIFADVSGKNISHAQVAYDEFNRSMISFTMNSEGAREMRDVTGKNIGKQLAIIMDGKVHSAPSISTEIGKHGSITGNYSSEEANKIAALLKSGSLDAPLVVEQENRVGASLGKDSIMHGLTACAISLILLFFFAVFYYRLAGFLAFLALIYNLFIILVFLSYFKATLTLPGMVLTIGMAIDSSILIYESIREALKTGMLYRDAVNVGFKDAMGVILDSNITTFIAGVVLFWFGGPAVKGFAVTLMLGIVATVLSGVFFLRSMFDFVLDNTKINKISV
jgi:preprotein translocase subunit SecD